MKPLIFASLASLCVAVLAAAVASDVITDKAYSASRLCLPFAQLADKLEQRAGEVQVGHGIDTESGGRADLHLFVNPDGSSWTVVYRDSALACIGTFGRGWTWSDDVRVVFGAPT